jgi:hypothetical protein
VRPIGITPGEKLPDPVNTALKVDQRSTRRGNEGTHELSGHGIGKELVSLGPIEAESDSSRLRDCAGYLRVADDAQITITCVNKKVITPDYFVEVVSYYPLIVIDAACRDEVPEGFIGGPNAFRLCQCNVRHLPS